MADQLLSPCANGDSSKHLIWGTNNDALVFRLLRKLLQHTRCEDESAGHSDLIWSMLEPCSPDGGAACGG